MSTRSFLLIVLLAAPASALAEHPSNGWIVWASDRNDNRHEIYRMKADGSQVTRMTTSGARMPMWSPDSRWIAYETVPQGRTRVMRWDKSGDKEIFNGKPKFWLWDGSRVVCMDSNDNLHKVNPENGQSSLWLSKSEFSRMSGKSWSPSGLTSSGRWLVTWTDRYRNGYTGTNGTFDAYHSAVILDINNKGDIYFFGSGCEPTTPPSGDWVYHVCGGTYCDWPPDVYKMKVADRQSRSSYQAEMAHDDDDWGHEYFPRISNDNNWVTYGATTGCHDHDDCDYEIFIHRRAAGSSNRERLTTHNKNDQWPHLYVGDLWVVDNPTLALSPGSLSFSATEGGSNPSSKTVSVTNSGSGTLNDVSASESAGWLTVSRSGSGNSQTLTNNVNISGLSAGSYNTTVTVSCANASNSPRTYDVSLTVNAPSPQLSLSPTSRSFTATEGGSNPSSKTISVSNSGGGTLNNVTTSESAGWLSVSRSGSGNSQTLTNNIDISGLTAGSYNTTVSVACANATNSPQTYSINLTVVEPEPVLELTPRSRSFTATEGGSNPSSKTIAVSNTGGGTLNNVTTSEGAGWLTVTRSGSGNNQTLTNAIDIGGLAAGGYNTIVTVSCANAPNSPQTYTINLTVAGPEPALALSTGNLGFSATTGGGNPPPQDISVSNAGDGTLDAVSANESVGWLSVSRSGSGNNQTLSNSVDISGLAAGSHEATVEVACANATNSPRSYTVTLDLVEQPTLAAIEVVPAATSLQADRSVDVVATPRDQNGAPIAVDINWSVSGGGSMSPPTSGGPVTEHTSRFDSDGSGGQVTVTASSGGVSGTADLTVIAVALPLRVNCGSNDFDVAGWAQDDAFVIGGSDWTNPGEVDTTGVEGAAPPEVYKSVRHSSPHQYDVQVPDGDYRLTLHFADAYTDRHMDYFVEGVQILEDFDIASEAGGVNRALVREFDVTVTGGDGMQIEAIGTGDVFEAGIELSTVVNGPPVVDAGTDQTVELPDLASLDAAVTDDGEPFGTLTLAWRSLSGPGDVIFADAAAEDTTAEFPGPGDYVLELTASDGALEASDTLRVTVVEQGEPAITLDAPNGGEVWYVGETERIRWSAVNVAAVVIRYSVDDGASWTEVADHVPTDDPGWGDLAWEIPPEPSSTCRVRILDYGGGATAESAGPFEIAIRDGEPGQDGGGDGGHTGGDEEIVIQGSCAGCAGATGASPWPVLLLLLLVRRRRYRIPQCAAHCR